MAEHIKATGDAEYLGDDAAEMDISDWVTTVFFFVLPSLPMESSCTNSDLNSEE